MSKKNNEVVQQSSGTGMSLGDRVREANAAVTKARETLAVALQSLSDVAREVYVTRGKGPWPINGSLYTIKKRVEKDENKVPVLGGKELYYFCLVGKEVQEL